MYKKVHHNLKKGAHLGGLAWREIPFQTLKSKRRRVRCTRVLEWFPGFPMTLPAQARVSAGGLGCRSAALQVSGLGCPGLVSASQFVFHSFLVVVLLHVWLFSFF